MSRRLSRILAYVSDQPWAILHPAAERMLAVLERRIAGKRLEQAQIDEATLVDREAYAARREAARAVRTSTGGAVAVVPVYGTILGRDWEFTQASHGGTTSAEALARTLRALDADAAVGTVVLDIDSPGGSVANIPETAAVIAGMSTPVVAQVNSIAASAAYWLASQADEIVATPSAELGSIGVYTMHVDMREANAQDGIGVEIIRAGEHKVAANPYEELTPEARADIQRAVDEFHGMFIAAVASGRRVSGKRVRERFGDGRMFRAPEALARGMADSVGTLDETIARFAAGRKPRRRRADAEPLDVAASGLDTNNGNATLSIVHADGTSDTIGVVTDAGSSWAGSGTLDAISLRIDSAPEGFVELPSADDEPTPQPQSDLDLRRRRLELL